MAVTACRAVLAVIMVAGHLPISIGTAQAQTISFLRDFSLPSAGWPSDTAVGVAVNATGVYVAGCTQPDRAFVRKYDPAGTEMWTRQFVQLGSCGVGVAVDGSGVYTIGRASRDEGFVRKFDTGGDELWTRHFHVRFTPVASGVAADDTGVYVFGGTGRETGHVRKYSAGGDELWTRVIGDGLSVNGVATDPETVYVIGRGNQGFVRKYSAGGGELWSRNIGLSDGLDFPRGVALDAGGVYVAGRAGSYAFLRRYDTDGNKLWTEWFGWGITFANAVAVDATGVYVAGETIALPGQCRAGGYDVFVRKYDSNGHELWTRQFGSLGNDSAYGVALDVSGVYVAGQLRNKALFAKLEKTRPALTEARPKISCIANAASFVDIDTIGFTPISPIIATGLPGAVSPGEMLTVLGRGIGPDEPVTARVTEEEPAATALAGVRVLFNGVAAPLLYVSDGQINLIAPYRIAEWASVDIEVEYRGLRSDASTGKVVPTRPGIFTRDGSGVGEAVAQNEDGSINSLENPASRGSVITIYATGGGLSDPAVIDGQVNAGIVTKPKARVQAWACCTGADQSYELEVLDARGVRGAVAGALQIKVRLPEGPRSFVAETLYLELTIGSRSAGGQVTLR